ncbi:hypothetical protein INR49_002693 [Caranx melampygus]|nr:hypothetical protein INR49_002693 [Caranx melampygus]
MEPKRVGGVGEGGREGGFRVQASQQDILLVHEEVRINNSDSATHWGNNNNNRMGEEVRESSEEEEMDREREKR